MDAKEQELKITRLIVIAIVIVLLSVIGSCAYTANQPADLTCEAMGVLNKHQFSLQECSFPTTSATKKYNLILTIDEVK